MEALSEELVGATWQEVALLAPASGSERMMKLAEDQPELLAFMNECSEGLHRGAREFGLCMFFVVYQVFEKGYGKPVARLTPEELVACFEKNGDLLEGLELAPDAFYESVAKAQVPAQPHLLRYVVDTLLQPGGEENPGRLADHETGFLFLLLKTVIDVLHRKTNGQA